MKCNNKQKIKKKVTKKKVTKKKVTKKKVTKKGKQVKIVFKKVNIYDK